MGKPPASLLGAFFFKDEIMADINEKELSREERLEMEEKAIQALLQYGVKFSVPLKIKPIKTPKRIMLWNRLFPKYPKTWVDKRIPDEWDVSISDIMDMNSAQTNEVYMRHFHIKPLYLGTIDYIRMLSIEMEYNEENIQENPIQESSKLMKYVPLMAKMVAVATLNCCSLSDPLNKEVKQLSKFYAEHLTVARLFTLCQAINQMSNRAGFTNSIRLILQVDTATTKPKADRIE